MLGIHKQTLHVYYRQIYCDEALLVEGGIFKGEKGRGGEELFFWGAGEGRSKAPIVLASSRTADYLCLAACRENGHRTR